MTTGGGDTAGPAGLADPVGGSTASWVRFLAGFALLYGVLAATSAVDATGRWGLAILAAVLLPAYILELARTRSSPTGVLRRLGLGRPNGRALAVAAVASGVILLVHPLSAAISGAPAQPRPQWWWLLIGLFAFHGLAEELVWRGFAFRRLRTGRTFGAAVLWTMPLMVVTHLPIALTLGWAVGVGAMLVAAVTSLPLSYLYETGGRTLWAPAVLHTAIDSFKLFVIPAAAIPTFSPLIIGAGLLVPLLVLAVPRHVLTGGRGTADHTRRGRPALQSGRLLQDGADSVHTG